MGRVVDREAQRRSLKTVAAGRRGLSAGTVGGRRGGTIALTCRRPGAATCAVALRSLVRDEPSVAITAKLGHASHPWWRQDGTGVIYSTESRVVVQTVADLQMQTYSAGIQAGEHVDYPTLAPDGTFGLCSVGRYGDQRVYRLCRFDVDGQEAASLATETAPTEGWGDMHPDISPDGRAALFSSDRECVGAGFDIWVRLLDGTVPEQALIRRAARPAWSPDGRWVAFDRYAGNATLQDLSVARLAGRRLPTDPQRASRKLGDSAVTRLVVWAGWLAVRVRLIAGNKWLFVARRPTDSEVNTSA
jgi:hypothetical protein